MSAKLIVVAGIDGSGKETQSAMLAAKFKEKGATVAVVSYPMYEKTLFGMLLDFVLKSKFTSLFPGSFSFANTDPLAASLLYGADRRQSLPVLKKLIEENDIVIFDRYVEANLIHQGGKLRSDSERLAFANKIMQIEYDLLELPRPDVTIYLHIPYEVSMERARKRAAQRKETPDAVEVNLEYVKNSYLAGQLFSIHLKWEEVSGVANPHGEAPYDELTADQIHEKICVALGIE